MITTLSMYFTLRFVAVAPRNGSRASIVGGTPVNGPSLLMNILLVKIKLTKEHASGP